MIQQRLEKVYQERYSKSPICMIFAPGRINLIGEHIDYNHGYTMPAAIDKGIYFAVSKAAEGVELYSVSKNETYHSNLAEQPSWAIYINGLLKVLSEKGLVVGSFHGVFDSDLPLGAGLSSSAALCSGLVFALDHLFQWNLSRLDMALIAQAAEHTAGINCGLMDQYAVLHGKKDKVLLMDCLSNSHEYFPINLEGHQLLLINSKVQHALMESAYNERRANCESAFTRFQVAYPNVHSFRDVTSDMLQHLNHELSADQSSCVGFVVQEIARVKAAAEALQRHNVVAFGTLLTETHRGLQHEYKVTCKETDLLVDLALTQKGVIGARQMGGGFGGCVLVLTREGIDLSEVVKAYNTQTDIDAEVYEVAVENGVAIL